MRLWPGFLFLKNTEIVSLYCSAVSSYINQFYLVFMEKKVCLTGWFCCKILIRLNFLQTFQNKRLAHAVKESTLDNLITELLLWLLDERVPHMDDGSQLLKALNVLMLKILVELLSNCYVFSKGKKKSNLCFFLLRFN